MKETILKRAIGTVMDFNKLIVAIETLPEVVNSVPDHLHQKVL